MPEVKLQSSDGRIFTVDERITRCSRTINTMLDDLGKEEGEDEIIQLLNVNSKILKKVILWADHHKDDPSSVSGNKKPEKHTDTLSSWDEDFLNVEQKNLFELILAANYLDIENLLDIACSTVANMIRGKTPEDIRNTFNITKDLTSEEEEQIRKENEWCMEK